MIKEKYFPKKTFVVSCFFHLCFRREKDNSFPLENIFHAECPNFLFVIPSQSFEYFVLVLSPLLTLSEKDKSHCNRFSRDKGKELRS